ncbi:MAG: rRNA small subunit methyltransferase B [Microbacteriaceae bacterium]|nr:rRNA small subunit methyltransferase B [Microbacteriaceae bacterium]
MGAAQRGARAVAIDVLLAVERDDAYANLLLPHRLRDARLHGADAALATELVYGALRLRGFYDEVIELAAKRPVGRIDDVALAALRLGAHQLLGMRVPVHAAVNETVGVVRARGSRGAVGFVNANLRAIAGRPLEAWRDAVADRHDDPVRRLAALHSHPEWIVRALGEALEAEGRGDELEALLAADNASPAVQLAALPGLAERDDVLAAHPTRLLADAAAPTAMRLDGGEPGELAEVRRGEVRVQDAGSQLVALALARAEAPDASGGTPPRWLDLCAGPGGKAALLAAEARLVDAEFQANEVVPARAGLVRDALRPLADGRDELDVTELDGRTVREAGPVFDRIMVDAPCSGLGALRRRPEARWRKRAADLAELAPLQEELLDSALDAVRPGGLVAYVTCSPHLAETTAVVRRALRRGDVEVLDAAAACRALAPGLELVDRPLAGGRTVQLWPHRHGTDAMFLALLRRDPDRRAAADG